MMKPRPIKQLLQVLHDSIEKNGMLAGGMCSHVSYMDEYPFLEKELLHDFITANRPKPG